MERSDETPTLDELGIVQGHERPQTVNTLLRTLGLIRNKGAPITLAYGHYGQQQGQLMQFECYPDHDTPEGVILMIGLDPEIPGD